MNITIIFPVFVAGIFLWYGYKCAYIINETKHDGKLKTVKIPSKWRRLFYLKGENVLLWSVIDQAISLGTALSAIVGGYTLYTFAPFRVYALFCMLNVIVAGTALATNDLIWMCRKRKGNKTPSSLKRCFSCELETAFRNGLPIRKVYVLSVTQSKGQQARYKVRCGKWSKREYEAMASKKYVPEVGTYVKAAYTKNKVGYSFILMSDWD